MFDVVHGLPVHALVVHAVVVLLPLLAIVTIAFTIRPRWRPGLPWAVLGNAVVLAATYVAKESGEKLQARLSRLTGNEVAAWHEHLAVKLPYFAIGQLIASILAYLLVGPRRERTSAGGLLLATVLVLAAGVAATVWTYRVGESGADDVWKATIANTTKP